VDPREGSKELVTPLRKMGLEVDDRVELSFGDVMFEGRGEGGAAVTIGIEFKKLEELVASLRSGRMQGHQLPGMQEYDFRYLVIEGELLYDKTGGLARRQRRFRSEPVPMPGGMTVCELLKRVNVMHLCGGLNPIWTVDRTDTLQHIVALYRTWTDTDLDKHKSHMEVYIPKSFIKISDMRRTLTTFPGIGIRSSKAVEAYFGGSLVKAVRAPAALWAQIEVPSDNGKTRKLGMKTAERIVQFCTKEL